jgi:hypothetical protein
MDELSIRDRGLTSLLSSLEIGQWTLSEFLFQPHPTFDCQPNSTLLALIFGFVCGAISPMYLYIYHADTCRNSMYF